MGVATGRGLPVNSKGLKIPVTPMRQLTLFVLFSLLLLVPAGANANLRIMPTEELVSNSIIIARVRVAVVDESEFGVYRQIATLDVIDVIEGDFTIKQIRVGAQSG